MTNVAVTCLKCTDNDLICLCPERIPEYSSVLSRTLISDSLRPTDCSPPGSSVHGMFQARILEWAACPPPGDLPHPGIKPRSPSLQVDSLPAEPPGKPQNTGVGVAYSFSRGERIPTIELIKISIWTDFLSISSLSFPVHPRIELK